MGPAMDGLGLKNRPKPLAPTRKKEPRDLRNVPHSPKTLQIHRQKAVRKSQHIYSCTSGFSNQREAAPTKVHSSQCMAEDARPAPLHPHRPLPKQVRGLSGHYEPQEPGEVLQSWEYEFAVRGHVGYSDPIAPKNDPPASNELGRLRSPQPDSSDPAKRPHHECQLRRSVQAHVAPELGSAEGPWLLRRAHPKGPHWFPTPTFDLPKAQQGRLLHKLSQTIVWPRFRISRSTALPEESHTARPD